MQTIGGGSRARWPFAAGTGLEISLASILVLAGIVGVGTRPGILTLLFLLLVSLVWALLLYFFRDPERRSPPEDHLVLSPADGRVLSVDEMEEREYLVGPARRVSIFLSLLDVHVNRSPVSGLVELVRHRPGKFHQAFRPEASKVNEHNLVGFLHGGNRILLKQIAGILARRVVCRARPGDRLTAGERFGLIKFGSRVEVYLPSHYEVCVREQDRVLGGVTILAKRPPATDPRPGRGHHG
jgi:phosphatidylserine decarboxylase